VAGGESGRNRPGLPGTGGGRLPGGPARRHRRLSGAITLEAWVYRSRNAAAEGLISIYDHDAAAGELALELTAIDGLRFGIASEPCGQPEMVWVEVPPEMFALGTSEWIHVAVTWDGEIVRFYNRGSPVYEQSLAVTPCAMDRPLTIGATGNALLPFAGWLDDVKLSSYAKTEGRSGPPWPSTPRRTAPPAATTWWKPARTASPPPPAATRSAASTQRRAAIAPASAWTAYASATGRAARPG